MPLKNREKRLEYGRRHYRENRDRIKTWMAGHYATNADRICAERALKRNAETRKIAAHKQRARYRTLRIEVIDAYGGQCACCGEREPIFLELDHVNGNGATHRREIGRGAHRTYKQAKDRDFPTDFQLLCANCNQGRQRNGGACPHVR